MFIGIKGAYWQINQAKWMLLGEIGSQELALCNCSLKIWSCHGQGRSLSLSPALL